jgi:hypothetical protein
MQAIQDHPVRGPAAQKTGGALPVSVVISPACFQGGQRLAGHLLRSIHGFTNRVKDTCRPM